MEAAQQGRASRAHELLSQAEDASRPSGIVCEGAELVIARTKGLRTALPHLWELPIVREQHFDGFQAMCWSHGSAINGVEVEAPAGSDKLAIIGLTGHRGFRITAKSDEGAVLLATSGHAV